MMPTSDQQSRRVCSNETVRSVQVGCGPKKRPLKKTTYVSLCNLGDGWRYHGFYTFQLAAEAFRSPVDSPGRMLRIDQNMLTGMQQGELYKRGCYRFACGCDIRKLIATGGEKYYSNNEQHGRLVYVCCWYVNCHFSHTVQDFDDTADDI